MHEASLARAILSQAVALAADNGGGTVQDVYIQIGPLSNVEPSLLATAFDRLRDTSCCGAARLHIEAVPLEARCRACETVFRPEGFRLRCPTCHGGETDVQQGDGVVLHSVVLADVEQGAST
jgi:hydrogenase nickel incorporation protein HypA/HybF